MLLVAEFVTVEEFLTAHEQEIAQGGLLVRGAEPPPGTPPGDCTLEVRIAGGPSAQAPARLAAATPGVGVMVVFPQKPAAIDALAQRLAAPIAPKKEALSLQEKLALAMSCDRDLRFQLLRDPNKQLHPLVLRNPRLGLEEVVWAAKLTPLNPDAR